MSATGEQRKTVTVVFCDLAGSTALGESVDPERLRVLLAQYFEQMRGIVERHGGTVEKFIGDAVMAVFGVPVVHEDDALRAVRAASEMRDALPGLGLEGRIGVMTGEVVTGTEERLVTGDAVNVAARLEAAAASGEVLIGEPTLALVREAVEAQAVEALALKGKAEPVPAYRLLAVNDAPERRHDTPFVGRERELALLRAAWARVVAEQRCELVTIVGEAGVGKSRLVSEAIAALDAAKANGRCPPYGEGITYWPVVEVLKQLDVRPADEAAAAAIGSLLGESDAPTTADEIAWAFRKTLEHAAAAQPLVVAFDDIQWGEDTFRGLVEHVAFLSTGAPILLLCVARPDLVERQPDWPIALRLGPLPADAVDDLIPKELATDLRHRIAHAAGGNPLFIGEMLELTGAAGTDFAVPPTLQSLLAARLDQLEPTERTVLECGAVEGEIFHLGALRALADSHPSLMSSLAALVRTQMIRPTHAMIAGDDAYRFHHILLRDTAYHGLAKTTRAELHRRLADWLEHHASDLVELDELLGYHLEQAERLRSEVGLPRDDELVAAIRRRLTAAGQRAGRRQDYTAAIEFLERATAHVPPSEVDPVLERELADALAWAGRGDEVIRRAEALIARAAAAGDVAGELCAKLQAGCMRLEIGLMGVDDLARLVGEALPVLESSGDAMALYLCYSALADTENARGRFDAALDAYEQALDEARRRGYEPAAMLATLSYFRFVGSTPVEALLSWLDGLHPSAASNQFVRAYRGWSLARIGRFDEARAIIAEARVQQTERGGGLLLANLIAFESLNVELLAGDPERATRFGAEGCRMHEELQEFGFLAASAGEFARALYAQDRFDEAERWADRASELQASSNDAMAASIWRSVKARLLARRGEHADADRLAHDAVALADGTDAIDVQGDAYSDLAEVLVSSGKHDEGVEALTVALHRYQRKGNLVMAQRVRERLDALQSTPGSSTSSDEK